MICHANGKWTMIIARSKTSSIVLRWHRMGVRLRSRRPVSRWSGFLILHRFQRVLDGGQFPAFAPGARQRDGLVCRRHRLLRDEFVHSVWSGIWPHPAVARLCELCRFGVAGWSRVRRRCSPCPFSFRAAAKLASILVSFMVNFSLSHFLVFRDISRIKTLDTSARYERVPACNTMTI